MPGKTHRRRRGRGQRLHVFSVGFVLIVSLVAISVPTYPSKARLLTLDEMVARAGRIVTGRCIGTRGIVDQDSGVAATLVTVRVDDRLKGEAPPVFTFKVPALLAVNGGEEDGGSGFAPGEDLILFLYGESPSGFTSPLGFGQGKFVVGIDKNGRRLARNATGNVGLLKNLRDSDRRALTKHGPSPATPDDLTSDALIDVIRSLQEGVRPEPGRPDPK